MVTVSEEIDVSMNAAEEREVPVQRTLNAVFATVASKRSLFRCHEVSSGATCWKQQQTVSNAFRWSRYSYRCTGRAHGRRSSS
jgi:hypothetical protein